MYTQSNKELFIAVLNEYYTSAKGHKFISLWLLGATLFK